MCGSTPTAHTFLFRHVQVTPMREITEFRTGADGSLVLALTPGEDVDDEDIQVELSGRTIHVTTPDGDSTVGLEVVHGARDES